MGSTKIYRDASDDTLPNLLRELADAIEQGGTDAVPVPAGFDRLKLSFRTRSGQLFMKGKFKTPRRDDAPNMDFMDYDEYDKPGYSSLKSHMKTNFRTILRHAHRGELPPAEVLSSFMADSRLMVTYPGYGDEFYPEYLSACERLEAAYAAGDVAAFRAEADTLAALKARCHDLHD